ncbi:oligosaccharide flippase family protein [Aurantiacibacter aquimixticola]|uniref:Polysaccharide biosynthesis protein n=1 Tax=Aurantiacibacter aquimixticola TaxID=1958945 RepID=A0A419RVS4_9SPHN|nr:oligosaccharide flippase family protein [Aurantiacibacter aquimixticola]RJY09900.1 polysaccharide biosynthesis protein [Aurantiacibacter aquimixticola]
MKDAPTEDAIPEREAPAMSVGNAAVWAMASQYVTFAIIFATSVVISRYFLGPDEVGLFSIALAAALLLAVLQDFGLTRYIAGLKQLTQDEIDRCSTVALVFSLIIAALVALAAWPLAQLYDLPQLTSLLLIIAASYFFVPFAVVPLALMGRAMRFSGHFGVSVGGALIHGAVAVTLAWLGFSAFSLAWATLASAIAKALIAQALQPARPFPLRLDGLKPIIGFGGKTSALYITGALGTRTPDLVVGKLVGLTATGLFSRATSLAEQLRMLIAGAIGQVFYPTFARIRDSGKPLGPAYLRICAGYSVLVLPGMAFLSLAAEPIVMLLYGEAWIGTAPLLTLIAIQSGLMICLPMVTELPILTGHINRLIGYNIVETVVSIGLLAVGTHLAGAEGAAASRIVYAFAFFAIYMRFISTVVGFRVMDWLAIMAKSLLVTAIAVAPLALAYAFWIGPGEMGIVPLALCAMAGGLAWCAALFLTRHPALRDMRDTGLPIYNSLRRKLLSPREAVAGDRI